VIAPTALLTLAMNAAPPAASPPPLLLEGRVAVSAESAPRFLAIGISRGSIVFVGDPEEGRRRYPGAAVLRNPTGVIYPGWADAHAHLAGLGEFLEEADMRGAASAAECVRRLAAATKSLPPAAWAKGRGWDQNTWTDKRFPDARELDQLIPDRAAAASRIDGHVLWVNSAALRLAGITASTPEPPGGKIIRRADGTPSGVFVDDARELIWSVVPPPGEIDVRRQLRRAMDLCAKLGLTEVGDASAYGDEETARGADRIEVLRATAREGELPIRVYATIGASSARSDEHFRLGPFHEGLLTVRSVKVYADGALGSRGAALLADYSDEPGNRGGFVTPESRIESIAERCFRAGFQLWIHAIGDAANRAALDAIEAAERAVSPNDARPRIEHAQVVSPEDRPRFARLGVIASIQPVFATSDMPWAKDRLSAARVGESYAWRSLAAAGARLAGGSDFPNDIMDPRVGIYAAAARRTSAGEPSGGWRPEEDLSREAALALYTSGAAYAAFEENRRGTIEVGKAADFTIVDRDLVACPAEEIPKARILATIVAGKVIFSEKE
jgi:predicted amidohydrolase YtcJ